MSGCNNRLTDELESISGKREVVAEYSYYSEIFLDVLKETMKINSIRISGVWTKIRTENLPNTSLECCL